MKNRILGFLLGMASALPGAAAEPDPGFLASLKGWELECVPRGCVMKHTKVSQRYGEQFEVYLTGAFERDTQKAAFFAINLPGGANTAAGVTIFFLDPTSTEVGSPTEVDRSATVQLPFAKCDEKSCVARIPEGIALNGAKQSVDVIAHLNKHAFAAYQFKVGDETRDVLDSLAPFQSDYQKMLTELKKPQ